MAFPLKALVSYLADHEIECELQGDPDHSVAGLATLASAQSHQLTFLANPKYRLALKSSEAGACLVTPAEAEGFVGHKLLCSNPYLAYAVLSHRFVSDQSLEHGIHKSAVIDPTAEVASSVSIAPNVVIEAGAVIGEHASIGPNCVIGAQSVVGDHCRLHANVTLYTDVTLGARTILHSGAVLGADGFGFANRQGEWVKIAQLGGVTLGCDVEVGAGTTIDRGALEDTVIGSGVIIDNQVQIAHNVKIGDHTAIAGCVGVAGSTEIGRYCTIAGAAGIAGHLKICDHVHITMQAQVTRSIKEPGSYSSGTGLLPTGEWRKAAVYFRQLERWVKQVKRVTKS